MRVRYENWVNGLNGDWLLSRQRFLGVPIPVWYPLDAGGEPVYDEPIPADEMSLPVDQVAGQAVDARQCFAGTVRGPRAAALEPAVADLAAAGHAARIESRTSEARRPDGDSYAVGWATTAGETTAGSGLYVAAEF